MAPEALPPYGIFPPLNAALNAISGVLILTGHSLIHRGRMAAHRACMISAVFTSTLFLVSYVYYHATHGVVRFHGAGWIRPVYLSILVSHTFLAFTLLVLVPLALLLAVRSRFERHKAVARWTYPIWVYVSVTGVVIYFMVYR